MLVHAGYGDKWRLNVGETQCGSGIWTLEKNEKERESGPSDKFADVLSCCGFIMS